jgi:hypothetical protein
MMVDITYQMVLSTLQTAGLLVGILYYIFDLQNKREDQRLANTRQELLLKSQEQALETRQVELYISLWEKWNSKEFAKDRYDSYRMEWINRTDFHEKFNPSSDWEAQASWNSFGRSIEGLADLHRKNLIDIEFLDHEMLTDISGW